MKANVILDTHAESDEDITPNVEKLLEAAKKVRDLAEAPPKGWFDKFNPDLRAGLASQFTSDGLPVRPVARFIEFASPKLLLLVADWLEAEAKALTMFPAFAEVLEAAIQEGDQISAKLKIGVTPEGNLDARIESTPAALELAHEILNW